MGTVNIKVKIMPSSPGADLKKIQGDAKKIVEREGGKGCVFEEEPIAFGLKAVIATFAFPEEKPLEWVEKSLGKIKDVNSVQIIDMRRAFG